MTEFVHCKSPHEEGVISALGKCKSMWLDRILSISPARLVFITGVKSGSDFANLYIDFIGKINPDIFPPF
jgi:hypothetical protein